MKTALNLLWAFALGRNDKTAAYALSRLMKGQPITKAEEDSVTCIRNEFEELLRKYADD